MVDREEDGHNPKKPRRFEVVLPPEGDSPHAVMRHLALTAMIDSWGGNIVELTEKETVLETADFLDISKEAYGDERYGQLAVATLEAIKSCGTYFVLYNDSQSQLHMKPQYAHYELNKRPEKRLGSSRDYERDTAARVHKAARGLALPYTTLYRDCHYEHIRVDGTRNTPRVYAVLSPENFTAERLAAFLKWRPANGAPALADHTLHGAIGRAYDVLKKAAGLVDEIDTEATAMPSGDGWVNLEWILETAKRDDRISTSGVKAFRDRLKRAWMKQLETGQPASWGEVIVNGNDFSVASYEMNGVGWINHQTIANLSYTYKAEKPELTGFFEDAFEAYQPLPGDKETPELG